MKRPVRRRDRRIDSAAWKQISQSHGLFLNAGQRRMQPASFVPAGRQIPSDQTAYRLNSTNLATEIARRICINQLRCSSNEFAGQEKLLGRTETSARGKLPTYVAVEPERQSTLRHDVAANFNFDLPPRKRSSEAFRKESRG